MKWRRVISLPGSFVAENAGKETLGILHRKSENET
jgi:hypothetical protein